MKTVSNYLPKGIFRARIPEFRQNLVNDRLILPGNPPLSQ